MSARTRRRFAGQWLVMAVVVVLLVAALITSAVVGVGPLAPSGDNASTDDTEREVQDQSISSPTSTVLTGSESSGSIATTTDSTSGFSTVGSQPDGERTDTVRPATSRESPTETKASRDSTSEADMPGFDTPEPTPTRETITQAAPPARSERKATATSGGGSAAAATDIAAGMGTKPDATYTLSDFRRTLESRGITVLMLSFDRTYPSNNVTRPIVLEYATNASTEKGYRDEAGVVAKAYAAAVADGYQPRGLSATAFDSDRQPVASYRVERSWASAYASGGLSGQKYGQRIGETYQSFGGDSTQAAGYGAGTAHRLDDKVWKLRLQWV